MKRQNRAEFWSKLDLAMGGTVFPWAVRGPHCLGTHFGHLGTSMMALHHYWIQVLIQTVEIVLVSKNID